MKRLKEAWDWRFWIWMPILGWLVPFAINESPLTANVKIIFSLFVANMIFSAVAGAFLRKRGAFWYLMFVWPLVFLVSVWLQLNSPMYGYYLAALYFVIELFAFTRGQEEEVDIEDQIPVDGGFREI
ncbi:hypothetical protein ACXN5V_07710 [Weissella confusa]